LFAAIPATIATISL